MWYLKSPIADNNIIFKIYIKYINMSSIPFLYCQPYGDMSLFQFRDSF